MFMCESTNVEIDGFSPSEKHVGEAFSSQIPRERQRPVLLMGPPGVGKTAIMRQIAEEMGMHCGYMAAHPKEYVEEIESFIRR